MLNLIAYGAAQTTTGSMHLLEWRGKRILLDCGLFQGRRKEAFERNRQLPFAARQIDAVILSHAHIDHSGNLPSLVRQGFHGAIYATSATKDLCEIMLRDSAHLQERDVELVNKRRLKEGKVPFEQLYNQQDVDRTMKLFRPAAYHEAVEVAPELRLTLFDAGHILGSATVALDYVRGGRPRRFLFTGDLGQRGMPILRDPDPVPGVDTLLTESTYGDRLHPSSDNVKGRLKDYLTHIHQHRSKLVIPAFSVGRTQQLLYFLNEIIEQRHAPQTPVVVDSPLSRAATGVHASHRECFDEATLARLARGDDPFMFPGLRFTTSVDESKALNDAPGPLVILSASGMCEGGRILHHLKNNVGDPTAIVLIVGFQAEHTLGRRIVERVSPLRIFGDEYTLRASVYTINALSGHADRQGLLDFYKSLGGRIGRAFCVHGEPAYCEANARQLRDLGVPKVEIPVAGQRFENL